MGGFVITPAISSAAQPGQIISYNYLTHYSIGETVRFTATIKNIGTVFDDYYIQVVLTNLATGVEVSPYPTSGDGTILPNATMPLTTGVLAPTPGGIGTTLRDWAGVSGMYTVTILLYNSGAEAARVTGSEPVHVGSTTDSVAAFPRVIDLGTLQYGRYMHPMPFEVNWSFYSRSTQVRKDHPWYMRLYTDNHRRYEGISGAIYSATSPAGLVSSDGKYTIPLKIWCLNYGPGVEDGWDTSLLGPPPIKEDSYWKGPLLDTGKRDDSRANWSRIPDYIDMTADPGTWRKLIGQDPYNTQYVSDSNLTGDFTLSSPFQVFIAYETSPTAVVGKYSTDLILEIYSP